MVAPYRIQVGAGITIESGVTPTPPQQPLLPIGHPDFWKQFKQ